MAVAGGGGASYLTGMRLTVSTNTGMMHDNYADISQAYGLFYGDPPANVVLCGNYNLVTGQLFPGESVCPTGITEVPGSAWQTGLAASANPVTNRVVFSAPGQRISRITILDAQGHLVRTLDGAAWDGTDRRGCRVAPGLYFVRVNNDRAFNGKIIVVP
jgi:hypothetical protein